MSHEISKFERWLSHFEVSPREREDEARRDERDFGTQEYDDQAEQDARREGWWDREE